MTGQAWLLAGLAALAPAHAQGETVSSSPVAKYWLRMYPVEAYAEFWHFGLKVKDLAKALPKVLSTLKKNGAEALVPIGNEVSSKMHGYQQLSFRVPDDAAARTVKTLGDLGDVEGLVKTPGGDPAVAQEAAEKLDKLKDEQRANKDALGKMPTTTALEAEVVDHLELVLKAHREAQGRVLLNIELQEMPKPERKASK